MSEEEDKYFKKREAELLADKRREQQLAAIRQQEAEDVRDVLDTNEQVAQEAIELGFDSETARVLPLVPLIQMAWADGEVTAAENRKVLDLADKYGIHRGRPDHNFLKLLLDEKPSPVFFERVNRVIAHLVEQNPKHWVNRSLVDLSKQVAEASGGFFGLGDPINDEERDLLDEFATLFSVDAKTAGGLFDDE